MTFSIKTDDIVFVRQNIFDTTLHTLTGFNGGQDVVEAIETIDVCLTIKNVTSKKDGGDDVVNDTGKLTSKKPVETGNEGVKGNCSVIEKTTNGEKTGPKTVGRRMKQKPNVTIQRQFATSKVESVSVVETAKGDG